jgi:eukaryotic-like serine/threonine-protein kinase
MTTDTLHPDQLQRGHMVGTWRIQESLGSGAFGHSFKAEDEQGHPYTLKMSVRPFSLGNKPHEEDFNARMEHEVAAMLAYPQPLRVHAMGRWPDARGYLYFVTDYVDGETLHQWCQRTRPTASELWDVFTEVVRQVGELHRRGVLHRDLKASNILIRKEDRRPVLIDFGVARLPGAATLTRGLVPGTLYMQPPEVLSFARGETWKQGARFEGGVAADLYALGVILYEALTGLHPFNPRLPDGPLLLAIEALVPTPPRQLNPRAPRSLSDIAMRLLEKRPEDRYPSAEALHQALWEAARERKSPAWKQPLVRSEEELPEEASVEAVRRRLARKLKDANEARTAPAPVEEAEEHTRPEVEAPLPSPERRRGWLAAVLASGLLIGLLLFASWRAWGTFGPPLQPGSPPVPTSSVSPDSASSSQRGASREVLLTALLCGFFSVGCTAAPVKPPQRGEDCPAEARHFMFKELKISPGSELKAVLDIHQPGDQSVRGVYREGPLLSRVSAYSWADPGLPAGTLLYGYLWTGPGYHYFGKDDAVIGRYTEALLPDGRRGPICMVIGGPNDGLAPRLPGSTPEAIQLPRELPVSAVRRWP